MPSCAAHAAGRSASHHTLPDQAQTKRGRVFRPGERIYMEGDRAEWLYKVASGAVRTWKSTGDGRRQILSFYVVGDFFGFDATDGEHQVNAEAVDGNGTVVLSFNRQSLESEAIGPPAARDQMRTIVGRALAHAHRRSMLAGCSNACAKVAFFLLEMLERLPSRPDGQDGGWISLPMSRTDIADYLCLSLETTCRTLHDLRRSGCIALRGTRQLRVLDGAALREKASLVSIEVLGHPGEPAG